LPRAGTTGFAFYELMRVIFSPRTARPASAAGLAWPRLAALVAQPVAALVAQPEAA
jgi:hypothetical protein